MNHLDTMPSAFPFATQRPPICWIFCHVIDNFGDIGVSWRLANLLQQELAWEVHLWIDDIASVQTLLPELTTLPCTIRHITLHHWQAGVSAQLDNIPMPDMVIETFACDLPPSVLHIIEQHRPLWLNWEYLSAELWAEKMHAKQSLQANGTEKYFWLMGFSETSGGLLRERHYLTQCSQWKKRIPSLRCRLQLPETKQQDEWLLFGYESDIWAEWLDMWLDNQQALTLLLAGTQIINSLKKAGKLPNHALINDGDSWQIQHLTLHKLPFVAQDEFDVLLYLADGLMIRGEDSFVRAQFTGKPFFWHIYPQAEAAHLDKLDAFWQRVQPHYHETVFHAHQALSLELNGGEKLSPNSRLRHWQTLQQHRLLWQKNCDSWQNFLLSQHSSIEKLAKFIHDKLK